MGSKEKLVAVWGMLGFLLAGVSCQRGAGEKNTTPPGNGLDSAHTESLPESPLQREVFSEPDISYVYLEARTASSFIKENFSVVFTPQERAPSFFYPIIYSEVNQQYIGAFIKPNFITAAGRILLGYKNFFFDGSFYEAPKDFANSSSSRNTIIRFRNEHYFVFGSRIARLDGENLDWMDFGENVIKHANGNQVVINDSLYLLNELTPEAVVQAMKYRPQPMHPDVAQYFSNPPRGGDGTVREKASGHHLRYFILDDSASEVVYKINNLHIRAPLISRTYLNISPDYTTVLEEITRKDFIWNESNLVDSEKGQDYSFPQVYMPEARANMAYRTNQGYQTAPRGIEMEHKEVVYSQPYSLVDTMDFWSYQDVQVDYDSFFKGVRDVIQSEGFDTYRQNLDNQKAQIDQEYRGQQKIATNTPFAKEVQFQGKNPDAFYGILEQEPNLNEYPWNNLTPNPRMSDLFVDLNELEESNQQFILSALPIRVIMFENIPENAFAVTFRIGNSDKTLRHYFTPFSNWDRILMPLENINEVSDIQVEYLEGRE